MTEILCLPNFPSSRGSFHSSLFHFTMLPPSPGTYPEIDPASQRPGVKRVDILLTHLNFLRIPGKIERENTRLFPH